MQNDLPINQQLNQMQGADCNGLEDLVKHLLYFYYSTKLTKGIFYSVDAYQ